MAIDQATIRRGLSVAGISAIIGLLSAGLALYTQASGIVGPIVSAKLKKDFAPIGTIVSSVLDPVTFAEIIGEVEGASVKERTWVLADGRDVTDSQYSRTTHKANIPDLRDLFLRGIDAKNSRVPGAVEGYATALPSIAFTGVAKAAGGDLHFNEFVNGTDAYNVGGRDVARSYPHAIDFNWAHTHAVEINAGGDAETRPRNAAVFYYIKVN
jgi:hypothetical protein